MIAAVHSLEASRPAIAAVAQLGYVYYPYQLKLQLAHQFPLVRGACTDGKTAFMACTFTRRVS